ncbi:hypothetical protein M2454_000957 [Aequitasia blattaphilus]|uniref:ABC transporter permease n=1 Tax=Aequitasia blattaphilus TaxID=2949332 RepID=A0ABT1E9D5_9FIRM|nr:hypothetical protein [Aequitasia blattaphilus]MCP1102435.1 hypothetical protein [Aequitasia blattaphilus]MCR8615075.1 hypothetical protein [Aequitasia blattaphilus]
MNKLVRLELKKAIVRKGVLITWGVVLFLVCMIAGGTTVSDSYSSVFQKIYLVSPLMGILMFMIFSEAYIMEYKYRTDDSIKTTKKQKEVVIAKSIANTIAASLICISILAAMMIRAASAVDFQGLDTPIKEIWFLENSGSNITVLEMAGIQSLTFIIGSFLFAQIGLFLSSTSKSAVKPFLLGGIVMGIPFLGNIYGVSQVFPLKFLLYTPLYGMFSSQLIRYGAPTSAYVFDGIFSITIGYLFYRFTIRSFTRRRG